MALKGYFDADWIGSIDTRRSTTRIVCFWKEMYLCGEGLKELVLPYIKDQVVDLFTQRYI